jgi:hypothetical protein
MSLIKHNKSRIQRNKKTKNADPAIAYEFAAIAGKRLRRKVPRSEPG